MNYKQIETYLSGYKSQRGGSYIFIAEDAFFRPNWLHSVYVQGVRIYYLDEWLKIEFNIEGEWEKFYEGSCKNMEQFEFIYKELLNIEV